MTARADKRLRHATTAEVLEDLEVKQRHAAGIVLGGQREVHAGQRRLTAPGCRMEWKSNMGTAT